MNNFPYYEKIVHLIKNDFCVSVSYENKKNDREVWCVVNMLDGKSYNIYKGKAKATRLEAVFKALEEKVGILI